MRRRTTAALIGPVMVAVMAACGSGGRAEEPMFEQLCQDWATGLGLPDEACEDGDDHGSWVYVPHGHSQPAVGSKTKISGGTTTRPGGSIARVPATGGFGTHAGTIGS